MSSQPDHSLRWSILCTVRGGQFCALSEVAKQQPAGVGRRRGRGEGAFGLCSRRQTAMTTCNMRRGKEHFFTSNYAQWKRQCSASNQHSCHRNLSRQHPPKGMPACLQLLFNDFKEYARSWRIRKPFITHRNTDMPIYCLL